MNPTIIKSFRVGVFTAALKRPFVTSLGRKTLTQNVAVTLRLRDGSEGYGEASASLALAHLSPARLARALRSLGAAAIGKDARALRALIAGAWKSHGHAPPAVSAFECALVAAWLKSSGLTLAGWLGGKLRSLDSDVTISAWDPETTAAAAREAAREGFRALKIKVGGEFSEDLARVRSAVAAGGGARLLLDGNQGMTLKGALRLVEACLKENMPVTLLEQPLPKTDDRGMAALTRRCPVPVAADEMVMTPADAVKIADRGAARVINIKVAKSGLLRSLEIAAVARAASLDLMIGCMAETGRGLGPSAHLALGTGFFRYVDLDSDHLLKEGGAREGWTRRGRFLSVG